MPQLRVVLQESIDHDGVARLEKAGADVTVLDGVEDPRLSDALSQADALIVRSTRVDEALIALGPGLRVIGRHGAGLDNIDLAAAARRGIRVVNTPRANTESVADYVIAATFHLLRRFDAAREQLSNGGFSEPSSLPGQVQRAGLLGREIRGARFGLVGAGAIGRAVAGKALALGATVEAYDPFADPAALLDAGIRPREDLDALIAHSDVLSLHLPGGPENLGIIDARRISLLPRGSVLINAARGGLVDHSALIEAVRSRRLLGAAVDVYDPEPPKQDEPILHEPNILATPHLAAMTEDAVRRMAVDVADAVLRALSE